MNTKRIAAIAVIFIVATAGWGVLGTATDGRTLRSSEYLGEQVEALWGLPLVQQAPTFSVEVPGTETVRWLMPTANNITVRIDADHRQKGLIWYSTYVADFDGIYTIVNDDAVVQKVKVHFDFPAEAIAAWKSGEGSAMLVIDHPNYGHAALIGAATRDFLSRDCF